MLLYAKSGRGKTSFAAQLPDCLFAVDETEEGIHDLKASGQVRRDIPVLTVKSWEEDMALLDELITQPHDHRYYVRDAIGATGLEGKLCEYVCRTELGGNRDKFTAYGHGLKLALPHFNEYTNKLEALRRRGVGVLLIAHSKVKTFNDPMRESYDQIVLDNSDLIQTAVLKWASTVGYIDWRVKVEEEDGKKAKAKGGWSELHLNPNPAFEAKNRDGITEVIKLPNAVEGFKNFAMAIKKARGGA